MQHLLAGKSDVPKTTLSNISIYSDEYVILDDYNIEEVDVHALELLENYCNDKKNFSYVDFETDNKIVSKVASYYGLNSSNPKIIRNANFAILYEETDDKIKIGEILFVDKVLLNDEEKDVTEIVKKQIVIALKQINPNNKEFDVSLLENRSKVMFDSIFDISPQEKEGGLSHGSK